MKIPEITGTLKVDECSQVATSMAFIPVTITITCAKTRRRFKFNPLEDITTFELALLMQLYAVVTSMRADYGNYGIDTDSYITSHKLERHFEITSPPWFSSEAMTSAP